jgi:four helix bundle protein
MLADFIFFQKFNDFIDYMFPIVDRFPNKEKFALCGQIKNHCYAIAQNIIDAHRAKSKYALYYKLDGQLEFLRWLLRHAHGRGFLAHRSFETSAKMVDELGKILGRLINPATRDRSGAKASAASSDEVGF